MGDDVLSPNLTLNLLSVQENSTFSRSHATISINRSNENELNMLGINLTYKSKDLSETSEKTSFITHDIPSSVNTFELSDFSVTQKINCSSDFMLNDVVFSGNANVEHANKKDISVLNPNVRDFVPKCNYNNPDKVSVMSNIEAKNFAPLKDWDNEHLDNSPPCEVLNPNNIAACPTLNDNIVR